MSKNEGKRATKLALNPLQQELNLHSVSAGNQIPRDLVT